MSGVVNGQLHHPVFSRQASAREGTNRFMPGSWLTYEALLRSDVVCRVVKPFIPALQDKSTTIIDNNYYDSM